MKKYLVIIGICIVVASMVSLMPVFRQQQKLTPPGARQTEWAVRADKVADTAKEEPKLPDISGYTVEAVRAMVPEIKPGKILKDNMIGNEYFRFILNNSEKDLHKIWQDTEAPQFIDIKGGVFDMASLTEAIGNPKYLEKTPEGYVLHIPVIISKGATLVIKGAENSLRMASDSGAFIGNFGEIYIVDTHVEAWNVSTNKTSEFVDKNTFRSFLYFWSGSKSYLAGSSFKNLGYFGPKAYGISYVTVVELDDATREMKNRPAPTGWVVGNTIEGVYYGFYSYEAEDVAIIGNVFRNNIVYGIDPHDRSKRLIIANNEAYGSKKKHGIILSREVNDSWIFGNKSHHNHGSGIMLDRQCHNTVIANNDVHDNEGDGIFISESPHNLTWKNRVINNKSGIRIRNSFDVRLRHDIIKDNKTWGIVGYPQAHDPNGRDLKMDPYDMRVGVDAIGLELSGNKTGHLRFINSEWVRLQDLRIFRTPGTFFGGQLAHLDPALSAGALYKDKAAIVVPKDPEALKKILDKERAAMPALKEAGKPAATIPAAKSAETPKKTEEAPAQNTDEEESSDDSEIVE